LAAFNKAGLHRHTKLRNTYICNDGTEITASNLVHIPVYSDAQTQNAANVPALDAHLVPLVVM